MMRTTLATVLILLGGCTASHAPARGTSAVTAASSPRSDERSTDAPPALLSRAPWSTKTDAAGDRIHVQEQARLRFQAHAGAMDLQSVHVYDEHTNDVGFFYGSAWESECQAGLSVIIYPATEPIAQHIEKVRAKLLESNPAAVVTSRAIGLDASHGAAGVHASYLNRVDLRDTFEEIALYERGGWFIEYRVTISPPNNPACEQQIAATVSALQLGR